MKPATLLHVLGLVSTRALANALETGLGSSNTSLVDPFQQLRQVCEASSSSSNVTLHPADEEPSTPATHSSSTATSVSIIPEATASSADPDNPEFVSFEEWKQRQLAQGRHQALSIKEDPDIKRQQDPSKDDHVKSNDSSIKVGEGVSADVAAPSGNDTKAAAPLTASPKPPTVQSHRYNYASPDCSARIHSASSKTQNPSSLLHKSKDRYMLTPCGASEHWVVVELCDEIRIEAIELGIFEFFSGVVREIVVSVGGEDGDGWEVVGEFVARNVRGVQSFTLPTPTSFHRFLKLEFPSHYGSEYYCPVSSLKAYGLNQMEAFKAEQKRVNFEREQQTAAERVTEERREVDRKRAEEERKLCEKEEDRRRETELDRLEKLVELVGLELDVPPPVAATSQLSTSAAAPETTAPSSSAINTTKNHLQSTPEDLSASSASVQQTPSSAALSANGSASTTFAMAENPSPDVVNSSIGVSNLTTTKTSTSLTTQHQTQASRPAARVDSSESIYAFIIRRVTALETSSTLTTRYIEEQMRSTRHLLLRIEKSWGEWKSQKEKDEADRRDVEMMKTEQRLGKIASQMEQQRIAAEQERRSIEAQLRTLTDELAFERRRGIAQLIILLVLLVLGVLTRGAKMEAVLMPLLAEAKRRSVSHRKSRLSGLSFDLGRGGLKKPEDSYPGTASPSFDSNGLPRSPSIRHRSTPRGGTARRPMTPTTAKRRSIPGRSFSAHGDEDLASSGTPTPAAIQHPRPRVSLPPGGRPMNGAPPRKLARSAHIHTLEADRVRNELKNSSPSTTRAASTPIDGRDALVVSPLSTSTMIFPTVSAPPSETGSTDYELTEASASEVEDDVLREGGGGVIQDLKKELVDVWNGH